ncbi:MAG: YvrJ family protein [bacterium]
MRILEDFLRLVANFGFPIVVSAYLLFRVESKLEKLSEVIVDLSRIVESLKANIQDV